MNIRSIKKAARRRIELFQEGKMAITRTMLWHWMLITNNGRLSYESPHDAGRLIFNANPYENNPWADRIASLKPNIRAPRILVTGTNSEMRDVADGVVNLTLEFFYRKYGLSNVHLEISSKIGWFWDHFYGTRNFFREAQDIPALIITTGFMRNYSDYGGETLEVYDRLAEIAALHRIPIERILSTCS